MAIDVCLMAAGIGWWTMLSLHPAQQPWLGFKLVLLLVYVVPGCLALKRAQGLALDSLVMSRQ